MACTDSSMWWPIIENLRDYLQACASQEGSALAGVDIHAGAADPITVYPCLEILWDEEGKIDLHRGADGIMTIWIDAWVQNDDDDPSVLYGLLHDIQKGYFGVLDNWTNYLKETLQVAAHVKVSRTVSDGDTNRPIGGSRSILEVDWRRSQYGI